MEKLLKMKLNYRSYVQMRAELNDYTKIID